MEVVGVTEILLPQSPALSTITRGRISVAQVLDREERELYQLTLVAQDLTSTPLSVSIPVSITVLDTNDNLPTFAQPFWNFSLIENIASAFIMEFNVSITIIKKKAESTQLHQTQSLTHITIGY